MPARSLSLTLVLLLLTGCIADNKTRQTAVHEYKPQINVPPPIINTADTGKLVEDTAARVSQNVKTDMAANQAQLSGHITGQIHKIEATLSELIKIEAKMDNKLVADLRADLTSTIQLMAALKVHMETQITLSNNMNAHLGNLSGQLDATVAGQAGIGNSIEKTMSTLQAEIKSGRDSYMNMLPQQAVDVITGNYRLMGAFMVLLMVGVITISLVGYRNARARQDDYAKLLMQAMGSLEPNKAEEIGRSL